MPEAVTLADPAKYFEVLDRASLTHWWGRSIEYVERRWLQYALRNRERRSPAPWSWLDVGCGTGTRLRLWADWGCWKDRVGIEPEIEAVEAAAADNGIEVRLGGLPDLPDDVGPFDVITAFDVLQHVDSHRRRNAIRAIVARLKPGGILLLRTNAPGLFRKGTQDSTIVDAASLNRWLTEAGTKVARSSRFNACGGFAEDMARVIRRKKCSGKVSGPLKTGLPESWNDRPAGHFPASCCGFVESRILATGLVNFPIGHSYLVMAIKDGNHDRSADG